MALERAGESRSTRRARNGGGDSTRDATTFNLPAALDNPDGSDYQLLLRDIDAIAVQLQKYEDAGVPVIWRPLHEAARASWFWWGAHGPENFKELWHVMHDRLTNHHGLHNLIWEFTSIGVNGDEDDWYPGDDEVDIVGLDIYTAADRQHERPMDRRVRARTTAAR